MLKTLSAGLLAASTLLIPSAASTAAAAPPAPDCLTQAPPACYTPRAFLTAYGVRPLLERGIDGRGTTVVLIEEAHNGPPQPVELTDIRQDLAHLDNQFGLPPARIEVTTTLAGQGAAPWLADTEEVLDTEIVHAVAPDATIREFLVSPADVTTPDSFATVFGTGVRLAVSQGDVISLSGSFGEHFFTRAEVARMHAALEYAAARHVTFVASSGDFGAVSDPQAWATFVPVKEVSLPASDPLVLSAGGTSLTADPATGAYISETAWNVLSGGNSLASAGGFSHLFTRPAYQAPGTSRGVPDVAGDAGPNGMAVAVTTTGTSYGLGAAHGTSAAAPLWAGLIALADQEAGHDLGLVNPAIYRIARGPLYHKAFHDITTGNNTVSFASPPATVTGYTAGRGWDPVTGWGTPNAQVLVPLLAR
jgi:subtilase family serine protease